MTSLELALNKLAKWRSVFAGWQLGTRMKGEPESDAVRDHREATIIMRAEMSAIVNLLVDKKLITFEEWADALEKEAMLLDQMYERRFPGFKATQNGMQIDTHEAQKTTRGWKP